MDALLWLGAILAVIFDLLSLLLMCEPLGLFGGFAANENTVRGEREMQVLNRYCVELVARRQVWHSSAQDRATL